MQADDQHLIAAVAELATTDDQQYNARIIGELASIRATMQALETMEVDTAISLEQQMLTIWRTLTKHDERLRVAESALHAAQAQIATYERRIDRIELALRSAQSHIQVLQG